MYTTCRRQFDHLANGVNHGSGGRSMLAVSRSEAALSSRIRLPSTVLVFDSVSDGKTTQNNSMFPLEEYFVIVEGYLTVRCATPAPTGTEKAARLLLHLMDTQNRDDVDLTDSAAQVGALLEKCATKLQTTPDDDSRNTDLLDQVHHTMRGLQESSSLPGTQDSDCPEYKNSTATTNIGTAA